MFHECPKSDHKTTKKEQKRGGKVIIKWPYFPDFSWLTKGKQFFAKNQLEIILIVSPFILFLHLLKSLVSSQKLVYVLGLQIRVLKPLHKLKPVGEKPIFKPPFSINVYWLLMMPVKKKNDRWKNMKDILANDGFFCVLCCIFIILDYYEGKIAGCHFCGSFL